MSKLFIFFGFLSLLASCNGGNVNNPDSSSVQLENKVPDTRQIIYNLLNAYPHDTAAFTQGLEIYQGHLYESTGLIGRASLRKVDLKTGKILLQKNIDTPYFTEGLTIMNDTLYQLTWENNIVFLYNPKDLKLIKKIPWSAQGWGITHDKKNLFISDGSDKIYVVRPGDLKLERVISVFDNAGPVNNLNELEFINGHIYANRWQYEYLLQINPSTGQVIGKIDLKDILAKNSKVSLSYLSAPGSTGNQMGGVLNGIAWDSASGKMLVTGKLWPYIFEIKTEE